MSNIPLYQEMRQKAGPLWQAIFAHAFVKGIGQDYLYLIDFSRVFALACAKSRDLGDMATFATLLSATLNMEMELHRKTCAAFEIPAHVYWCGPATRAACRTSWRCCCPVHAAMRRL